MGEIYKVINTITNEVYIGATTKPFEERKADHIQKANKGLGGCFQQAIATYGLQAFLWEQIDTAESIDELAQKEVSYIIEYNSKEKGYNKDRGGGFQKTIYQYDLNGSYVKSYDDLSSAALSVNTSKQRISNACLGKNKLFGNYYWSYKYIESFVPETDFRKKIVLQYDMEDNYLNTFESVAMASKLTGLSKTCISRCCRGERQYSGGYKWKYK